MTEPGAPVAYCAPGRKYHAVLALTLKGEPFSDVHEHPWLSDADGIILASGAGACLTDWQVPVGG